MAKQKFRPTRLSGFLGAKAYMLYVEVLKSHCNAVGRTFCDAIKFDISSIRDRRIVSVFSLSHLDPFVPTHRQSNFAKQGIASVGKDSIEGTPQLVAIEMFRFHSLTKQEVHGDSQKIAE
jgi:hypothetical protein